MNKHVILPLHGAQFKSLDTISCYHWDLDTSIYASINIWTMSLGGIVSQWLCLHTSCLFTTIITWLQGVAHAHQSQYNQSSRPYKSVKEGDLGLFACLLPAYYGHHHHLRLAAYTNREDENGAQQWEAKEPGSLTVMADNPRNSSNLHSFVKVTKSSTCILVRL